MMFELTSKHVPKTEKRRKLLHLCYQDRLEKYKYKKTPVTEVQGKQFFFLFSLCLSLFFTSVMPISQVGTGERCAQARNRYHLLCFNSLGMSPKGPFTWKADDPSARIILERIGENNKNNRHDHS